MDYTDDIVECVVNDYSVVDRVVESFYLELGDKRYLRE